MTTGAIRVPINSRNKGKVNERELAKVLTDAGFEARRGLSQAGGAITADVVGVPGHWVEAKARKDHACLRFLDQAKRDAAKAGLGEVPIAVLKENRSKWHVLVDLGVYLALLRAALKGAGGQSLELANFVEKPSRAVKVKAPKTVTKTKLAPKKPKDAA